MRNQFCRHQMRRVQASLLTMLPTAETEHILVHLFKSLRGMCQTRAYSNLAFAEKLLGRALSSEWYFFHGELYIKKRNHSLCLLSLRGSYKGRLFIKYWKDCCFATLTGKDVATSVEVFWPDGHSVARPLEPSDMNKVMEIYYPENEEEATPALEIEVHTEVKSPLFI